MWNSTNALIFDTSYSVFDVESLFTNIPLEESIDLAVEYILNGIPDFKIAHDNLKMLFFKRIFFLMGHFITR